MNGLPPSLPRVDSTESLFAEPLAFLAQARSRHGDVFVMREHGPIFSRASDCSGVIAVFGEHRLRQILTDIDNFALPMSAAAKMALPKNLVNLNRGLHSMREPEHGRHKRLLTGTINRELFDAHRFEIRAALNRFCEMLKVDRRISVVSRMRELTVEMASHIFLGAQCQEDDELAFLLSAYFTLRREASSLNARDPLLYRDELIGVGQQLDRTLRERIRRYRKRPVDARAGLLQRLATAGPPGSPALSEDEIVGHANVMFVSSTEPVAMSLTWLLLVLSQLPDLRRALRAEIADRASMPASTNGASWLENVVNETLRLLTPNALMVRATTRAVSLQGVALPARCEIVVCPFLAHREAKPFPDPHAFSPSRWETARPSPYEYFPFGAGGHFCAGRNLALSLIREVLSTLLSRFDFVLDGEQSIDWRIHIMLMPKGDPALIAHPVDERGDTPSPKWRGPITDLFHFAPGLS
ncbi:RiPP biosynthesis cytochrome P450 ApyO [Burkholderia thailandensis]|uniref:Cytochrome P450-related protein n=1 Tax=Burkholderia thailandensis (strain ATCC 700388 / DSM 13276 / CCUG 48851 / CIP 106301 / E264) TaxID=271848 RepID=Q2T9C1_BURTA|nr:cytochrome P450 [Burkholderia thailandensis]ABC35200.1 cytochrome P450-related protein [Burkholderia thailandensis E264]AHI75330.1 cytochrome P450 family protein [Burkholderia thailandensis 2002721723]AHI82208.1 cytochrome P450 family protein [Burkholderia thailandensis E444]AIC89137.1 cytochrome P450 family protein [Burkholderia thailandensis USAMRU Malaysia \